MTIHVSICSLPGSVLNALNFRAGQTSAVSVPRELLV